MISGLQRRLLVLLLIPLVLLAVANAWFDVRSADSAALQQDRHLLGLVPLLADSVLSRGGAGEPPLLLMAPALEEFLRDRQGSAGFSVLEKDGTVLAGEPWLGGAPPSTNVPEFSSQEFDGVTYRIVSQRLKTATGDLTVRLADGSDPRQQWWQLIWLRAVLPNMALVAAVFVAVHFAVKRALRPLMELKEAVEHRSPRDLSALDVQASPDEVRPLVQSLNGLFDLVNAQSALQRQFVADAAHQLRTPLAALQSQVEAWALVAEAAVLKQKVPAGQSEYAQPAIEFVASDVLRLRQAMRRISSLANQLLALSRVDARQADTQPMQRVDLKHLCEVMLETTLDAASVAGIDLGLDAQPVHVFGHEWLLRELLSNLLDNAIKYTPKSGHVTLRCGRTELDRNEGSAVAFLEVEDDGPGVPQDEQPRLLERFYRASGIGGEGSGLGLAIAQEIARIHCSHLQVGTARTGRGLLVRLELPL